MKDDERRRVILAPIMKANPDLTMEGAIELLNHQVPLSAKMSIKLIAMNLQQMTRRKRFIASTKEAPTGEPAWLDICIHALQGWPPMTRVSDLLEVVSKADAAEALFRSGN